MASIKKRGDVWRARYRDDTGKEHAGHFPTRAKAQRWIDQETAKLVRGDWIEPSVGNVTYGEWSERYFSEAHKRATTLARDRVVNDKHVMPILGTRRLASIGPADVCHIVDLMRTAGLAPATVRTNYGVLRAVLNAAVDHDVLARSPCRGEKLKNLLKGLSTRGEIRFLSAEELRGLADATPVEYRPMIYLAGVLGLRWSEVAGLRVGRVDFLRRTVQVAATCAEVNGVVVSAEPKSKASRRTLRAPSFVVAMLAEHLARRGPTAEDADELLFVAPEGGPLRRSTFRTRVFIPATRRAGLEGVTFHGLRHSAAGLMIEANAHIEAIKQRMGHSSIRVTSDVYGDLLPAVDEAVTVALEERFAGSRGLPADSAT
jgi:integrase